MGNATPTPPAHTVPRPHPSKHPSVDRPDAAGSLRAVSTAVRDKKRVLAASFVGTTIEWYDFYLYGAAAALVFNHYFFPQGSGVGAVIASFATFAIAFFFRPLGGVLLGRLADLRGRRFAMLVTILLMAGGSLDRKSVV